MMRWAIGVTTAPRPRATLGRTLDSLARAGFQRPAVFHDDRGRGAWSNWLYALGSLLLVDADALLLVQDDAVFCRGLRRYLDRTLWPDGSIALCSPYSPGPYRQPRRGWHQQQRGWGLVGALCWAIPRATAGDMLRDLGGVRATGRIDARLGKWAATAGRDVWYHTPSLVQHVGNGNSALGDQAINDLRRAADFVGEDFDVAGRAAWRRRRNDHR